MGEPPPLHARTAFGGVELIDRYADAWRALLADAPANWAFYAPGWVRIWYDAFGEGRRLAIVTVSAGDRLVAIAPFLERRYGPLRIWQSPANNFSGKADIVVATCGQERILGTLWTEIARNRWHAIDWRLTPEAGTVARLAGMRRRQGMPVIVRETDRTPIVAIGNGVDLDRIGPAKDHRRLLRRIAERGTMTQVVTAPATRRELDIFFHQEATSWKGRAGTDAGGADDSARFYRALVDAADTPGCTIVAHETRLDGVPIAVDIGLRSGDRHFALKGSYDEAWRAFGPGQVNTRFAMRDAADAGYRTFDFLGTDDAYKRQWTRTVEPLSTILFFRAGPLGRLSRAITLRVIPIVKRFRMRDRPAGAAAFRSRLARRAFPTRWSAR